ncbi:MAG: carboxypeptidase regulatory-like domain-containing protein [Bacteroidetes bacterium]|nr:carboxypeptidase regulatory-like domain-containing protein [Bacteroidota bacterium]
MHKYKLSFCTTKLFTVLLFFSASASLAQVRVTGTILSKPDKKPVRDVSVFLNNTTTGSKTAKNGVFTFENVPAGKYKLVVSCIGFEVYTQLLTVANANIQLPTIELMAKTIALKEVKIKARDSRLRQRDLALFIKDFIGTSDLASECIILNPDVLDLDYDNATATLTASSDDFLVIENKALGYRIKCLLTNFKSDSLMLNYQGSAMFELMSGTPSQEAGWEKKRRSVYEGSLTNFLRSLPGDGLEEKGFRVFRCMNYNNPKRKPDSLIVKKIKLFNRLGNSNAMNGDSLIYWQNQLTLPKTLLNILPYQLRRDDIAKVTDQKGVYALGCDYDALFIEYDKNRRFARYAHADELENRGNKQATILNFKEPYVFFDKNGQIINPESIVFNGAWGKYRVAELLPINYQPGESTVGNNTTVDLSLKPKAAKADFAKFETLSDSIAKVTVFEKLYLQFDKPYYLVNDTIWLKAYLLNAVGLTASDKSRLLHIDLLSDDGQIVKQYLFPVSGTGWGNIALSGKEIKPGNYVIRAYTNWMRNFGYYGFYYKNIGIMGSKQQSWLVNTDINTSEVSDGQRKVTGRIQITTLDKMPVGDSVLRLEVISGKRSLYHQVLQTDKNGFADLDFGLPLKTGDCRIMLKSPGNDITIPLDINNAEKADVQFLPEGGELVAGTDTRIGFKAIGEDGKGIDIKGTVSDHTGKVVASFTTLYRGMGSFSLRPQGNEMYTARISFADGETRNYPLPAVKASGTVISILDNMRDDSIRATISATSDRISSGRNYFFVARSRGITCYAAVVNFKKTSRVNISIPKAAFPSGVAHFLLRDTTGRPLNERAAYIDRKDNLHISISPYKPFYEPRDSVQLSISVTDSNGAPVQGDFSLAVTDDTQVKVDSSKEENILTRMLLTSDLKGYVEDPGYYFRNTADSWQALDDLLLTQGWVSYVPEDTVMHYGPEHEYTIQGHVNNLFGKPIKHTDVLLFSKSPAILMDTLTDDNGRFMFHGFPRVDTPVFILKTVNKRGKSFNVNIGIDEPQPPAFNEASISTEKPWYMNSDSVLLSQVRSELAYRQQQEYTPDGKHKLKGVVIKANKIIRDSQNLNGPGNADIVINEKDLEQSGRINLLDFLQKKIPGFRVNTANGATMYNIKYKWAIFMIDGIELSQRSQIYSFDELTRYLQSHFIDQVKGIEVNFSDKYTATYERVLNLNDDYRRSFAFIEITTRSKNSSLDNLPGMYLYKPLPISRPKQFYKPKYTVKDTTAHLPDLRSTIDWEPNVVTDKNGEAKVWFYTADRPSTYTIIVEGADRNGALGFKTGTIVVKPPNDKAK